MVRLLKNRRLLGGAGCAAILLAMALWPRSVAVDVATVERGPLQVTVDDEGETRVHDRFVISAPVAGRLLRIELEPGDRVERGRTLLATLRPSDPVLLDARSRAEAQEAVRAAGGGPRTRPRGAGASGGGARPRECGAGPSSQPGLGADRLAPGARGSGERGSLGGRGASGRVVRGSQRRARAGHGPRAARPLRLALGRRRHRDPISHRRRRPQAASGERVDGPCRRAAPGPGRSGRARDRLRPSLDRRREGPPRQSRSRRALGR